MAGRAAMRSMATDAISSMVQVLNVDVYSMSTSISCSMLNN